MKGAAEAFSRGSESLSLVGLFMSATAASSAMVTVVTVAESEFTGVPGAVAQQVAPPPEP